jgi:long-chain acyl-CoA synthetase
MDDGGTLSSLVRRSLDGPERPVLAERGRDGFVTTTNLQLLSRSSAVSSALRGMGIGRGDRVAIMSPNRVDWIVANLGVLGAGAVTVPLYPTQALDQLAHILDDSAARALFVDSAAALERLTAGGVRVPRAIVFDGAGDDGLAALERRGANAGGEPLHDEPVAATDLAVLIYTSGTTGIPTGVMLSHRNLVTTAIAAFSHVETILPGGDAVVSVLPWAHIYEHLNLYGLFARRSIIYVCHGPDELLADLLAVRPAAFFAVPRIFERVIAGMIGKAKAAGGVRARLVPWALNVGRDRMRALLLGRRTPMLEARYALARALVLRKVPPALGLDNIRFICSGSAPLHIDVALTFASAGITIYEGYGLTECSPVVCVNTPVHNRFGTVGLPIPGVEARVADDGELLVRGANVMSGYYHNEAATAAAIRDGWLATGDVASIDADGYIRITDRKNELFKTSGGKFIAPARVESALLRSPYFSQVVVLGSGRRHPVALVSPNWPLVRQELAIPEDVANPDASNLTAVRELVTREATAHTADLAAFEQIRSCALLPRELTIADGELSPTLKVRRRVVEARYAPLLERAYAAAERDTVLA